MKKIIFTASSLIFAVSLYVGVNAYKNSNYANNLLLVNVEALTTPEFANVYCLWDAEYLGEEIGGQNFFCIQGADCYYGWAVVKGGAIQMCSN